MSKYHLQSAGGKVSPTYQSGSKMKQRCLCKTAHNFRDMGERPKGTTLDRINPNGDHSPGNCRWSKNKARNRRNTRWVTYNGKEMPLTEFGKLVGIRSNVLFNQVKNGHDPQDLVSHYGSPTYYKGKRLPVKRKG